MRHMVLLAAALAAAGLTASAASAAGSGKYCLKGPGEQMNCAYQTMAACDKAKGSSQSCVANPSSTTGSGMNKSTTTPAKKY